MPTLSEEERVQLENEALRQVLQGFASLPTDVDTYRAEHVQHLVQKSRNILQNVTRRKKSPSKTGDIERMSVIIVTDARGQGIEKPCLVLERLGRANWEAYLDEYEEAIGVSRGRTGYEALLALRELVRKHSRVL